MPEPVIASHSQRIGSLVHAEEVDSAFNPDSALDNRGDLDLESTLSKINECLAMPDAMFGYETASLLIAQLELDEIAPALEHVNTLPIEHRQSYLINVVMRWAKLDGRNAIDYAVRNLNGDARESLSSIANEWAKVDPKECFAWALRQHAFATGDIDAKQNAHPNEAQLSEYYGDALIHFGHLWGTILSRWAIVDPEAAFAHGATLPDANRQWVLGQISSLFGSFENRRQSMLEHMRKLPEDDRSYALRSAARYWSMRNVNELSNWLTSAELSPIERSYFENAIVSENQSSYPDLAAEWLLENRNGETLEKELGSLLEYWASYDKAGAVQWAKQSITDESLMKSATTSLDIGDESL